MKTDTRKCATSPSLKATPRTFQNIQRRPLDPEKPLTTPEDPERPLTTLEVHPVIPERPLTTPWDLSRCSPGSPSTLSGPLTTLQHTQDQPKRIHNLTSFSRASMIWPPSAQDFLATSSSEPPVASAGNFQFFHVTRNRLLLAQTECSPDALPLKNAPPTRTPI